MRRNIGKNIASLALVLCAHLALCVESDRPPFDFVFHAAFDDSVNVATTTGKVAAAGGEGVKFVEGKLGKAAYFADGNFVEYHNLPKLDCRSVTIEFWVNPEFERRELDEHYFVRLMREDGAGGLDVFFSVNDCGFRAVMTSGKKKAEADADNAFNPRKWNQVVITWDTVDPDLNSFRLYMNGTIRMYAPFTAMPPPDFIRVGCKSKGEESYAKAAIDEIFIYNRCLTELQVLELYHSVHLGEQKIMKLREQVEQEEAERRRRIAEFLGSRKMAMVIGRTVGGLPDKLFESLGFPPPERIHEKDFDAADLGKYDMLLFPGGGGYVFTAAAQEKLREYIRNGGGYVGICAGAYAARNFKLTESTYYPFRERGMVELDLKKHPITEGFNLSRKLAVRHANGPFMEPAKDEQTPVFYRCGPPYAAIIAKEYGKGRVVIISPHPESQADSRGLVRNSILWASKIIGKDEAQDDQKQTLKP